MIERCVLLTTTLLACSCVMSPVDPCAVSGLPGDFSCPAECIPFHGTATDAAGMCTGELAILACYPSDSDTGGDGGIRCLTSRSDASVHVVSPSHSLFVDGEEVLANDWVQCDPRIGDVALTSCLEP